MILLPLSHRSRRKGAERPRFWTLVGLAPARAAAAVLEGGEGHAVPRRDGDDHHTAEEPCAQTRKLEGRQRALSLYLRENIGLDVSACLKNLLGDGRSSQLHRFGRISSV